MPEDREYAGHSEAATSTVNEPYGASRAAEAEPLQEGDRVGRYVVLGRLGAGGLSVVYTAWDPRLDRKIAIKLLRSAAVDTGVQTRLKREAQALAKLNHPHVVSVYDVGSTGGRVFLAIEYVEGQHLGRWLRSAQRSRREICDVFLGAGRGLAHAHDTGVVHRDFKLSNVMVRPDQRAVVLDFGLARSVDPGDTPPGKAAPGKAAPGKAAPGRATEAPSPAASSPTRAGSILGTPAFMAPEQWTGHPATAAADQFSFCVSLYLALCGRPPFKTASRGEGHEPPSHWQLPPWEGQLTPRLRKVLERGLSERPEDRFPSMHALLDALGSAISRRRSALIAATGTLAILGYLAWPTAPDVCQGGPGRLAEIWNDDRKDQVATALLSTEQPYASTVAAATASTLDRYGDAWVSAYRQACEATHVRGEQSSELLDRRMICLERRQRELAAWVDLLIERPAAAIEEAVAATSELTPLSACAEVSALTTKARPPEDAATRARIEDINDRLAAAKALQEAGRFQEASAIAGPAVADSEQIDYLPLRAEALFRAGFLEECQGASDDAADALHRASMSALAAGDDRTAADAFIRLVRVYGYQKADQEQGRYHAALAQHVLDRLSHAADLQAKLADQMGVLALMAGDFEQAEAEHRRALSLERGRADASTYRQAETLIRLGNAQKQRGELKAAGESYGQALDLQRMQLGEHHPAVGVSHERLGSLHLGNHQLDQAEARYQKALSILMAALGERHPKTAAVTLALGVVQASRGELPKALELYRSARFRLAESFGERHPHVARAWSNIGSTLIEMGDAAAALEPLQLALDIQQGSHGNDHPWTAITRMNLGLALSDVGEPQQASIHLAGALAVFKNANGGHPNLADALHGLAGARLGLGDRAGALAALEEALDALRHGPPNPRTEAECAWLLAQIQMADAPEQAAEAAARARGAFLQAGLSDKAREVETWLRQLPE